MYVRMNYLCLYVFICMHIYTSTYKHESVPSKYGILGNFPKKLHLKSDCEK